MNVTELTLINISICFLDDDKWSFDNNTRILKFLTNISKGFYLKKKSIASILNPKKIFEMIVKKTCLVRNRYTKLF